VIVWTMEVMKDDMPGPKRMTDRNDRDTGEAGTAGTQQWSDKQAEHRSYRTVTTVLSYNYRSTYQGCLDCASRKHGTRRSGATQRNHLSHTPPTLSCTTLAPILPRNLSNTLSGAISLQQCATFAMAARQPDASNHLVFCSCFSPVWHE
jgi:hypothetical protein